LGCGRSGMEQRRLLRLLRLQAKQREAALRAAYARCVALRRWQEQLPAVALSYAEQLLSMRHAPMAGTGGVEGLVTFLVPRVGM